MRAREKEKEGEGGRGRECVCKGKCGECVSIGKSQQRPLGERLWWKKLVAKDIIILSMKSKWKSEEIQRDYTPEAVAGVCGGISKYANTKRDRQRGRGRESEGQKERGRQREGDYRAHCLWKAFETSAEEVPAELAWGKSKGSQGEVSLKWEVR